MRLTEPGGPKVSVGRYPGPVEILGGAHPLARRADLWRKDIDCHERVLRDLVRSRFELKAPLEFGFMYAGYDSTAGNAIVRYFAHDPNPVELAGWEVFLVYALPRGRLAAAWVNEVPLE